MDDFVQGADNATVGDVAQVCLLLMETITSFVNNSNKI